MDSGCFALAVKACGEAKQWERPVGRKVQDRRTALQTSDECTWVWHLLLVLDLKSKVDEKDSFEHMICDEGVSFVVR